MTTVIRVTVLAATGLLGLVNIHKMSVCCRVTACFVTNMLHHDVSHLTEKSSA